MSEATAPLTASPSEAERRAGFLSAASAYIVWGFLPLYLKLLHTVDVREVLAQRILWAAPSALIAVFVMSGWRTGLREISTALKPSMIGTLAISACFIFVNWGLYVYLVLHERCSSARRSQRRKSSRLRSLWSALLCKASPSARRRGWRSLCARPGPPTQSFASARLYPPPLGC
ncbi:MAG: hypothetical protein ABL932_26490 [Terricaulis sp.]